MPFPHLLASLLDLENSKGCCLDLGSPLAQLDKAKAVVPSQKRRAILKVAKDELSEDGCFNDKKFKNEEFEAPDESPDNPPSRESVPPAINSGKQAQLSSLSAPSSLTLQQAGLASTTLNKF